MDEEKVEKRRRNISWRHNIDVIAIKLAADDGIDVSELLERLVLVEKARRAEPRQIGDVNVLDLIRKEVKRTLKDLADQLEQSGQSDLKKAADLIKSSAKKNK